MRTRGLWISKRQEISQLVGPFQATIELKCHIRIVTWILFNKKNNYDGVNQSLSITKLRYKYLAKFVLTTLVKFIYSPVSLYWYRRLKLSTGLYHCATHSSLIDGTTDKQECNTIRQDI